MEASLQAGSIVENAIEKQRKRCKFLRSLPLAAPTCCYADKQFFNFLDQLMLKRLWPVTDFPRRDLEFILESMEYIEFEKGDVPVCDDVNFNQDCGCRSNYCYKDVGKDIRFQARELIRKVNHICFDCVREGTLAKRAGCTH